MADEQSTSTDEAVDTSVSEDTSNESSDDGELEDIEVDITDIESNDDDEQQDEAEEAESEDESDDTTDTDDAGEETDEESEPSDEQREAEHRRAMYEQRQAEKQARIDKVRQDQAEYISEASEEGDPHEIALRQLQVDAYNNKVEAVSNKLTNGYERALADFPVLQTTDPVVQAEIDAAIDAFQAQSVTIDAYGNPTDVRGDLYATLQAKADSITKLTGIKVQRQAESKSKEKSKSLTPPRRAPQTPKVDPDIQAFDDEAWS